MQVRAFFVCSLVAYQWLAIMAPQHSSTLREGESKTYHKRRKYREGRLANSLVLGHWLLLLLLYEWFLLLLSCEWFLLLLPYYVIMVPGLEGTKPIQLSSVFHSFGSSGIPTQTIWMESQFMRIQVLQYIIIHYVSII